MAGWLRLEKSLMWVIDIGDASLVLPIVLHWAGVFWWHSEIYSSTHAPLQLAPTTPHLVQAIT